MTLFVKKVGPGNAYVGQGGNRTTSSVLMTRYFLINSRAEGPRFFERLPKAAGLSPSYYLGFISWAGRRRQPELLPDV